MFKLLTKHRLVSCLTGLLLLLLCGSLHAQQKSEALTGAERIALQKRNGVQFSRLPLLPRPLLNTQRAADIRATVSGYQVFELPAAFYSDLKQKGNTPVELTLPLEDGSNIVLELAPVNLFADGYAAKTSAGEILQCDGRYFQGIIKDAPSSFAAISMYNNEIAGVFSNGHGNYVVGRLQDAAGRAGSPVHVVYNDKDLLAANSFTCKTPDGPVPIIPMAKDGKDEEPAAPEATKCVRLYMETEYDVFQTLGSTSAVQQYLNTIYNVTNNVYQAAGATIFPAQAFIWTSNDPYNGATADATLTEFANYRRAANGGYYGDLGQLISFRYGTNNMQGLAGAINGLCSGVSRERLAVCFGSSSTAGLPGYNRSAKILAHEFGHLMGSQHTHACAWNGNNTAIDGCAPVEGSCPRPGLPGGGGTMMSYCDQTAVGINFALGLGTQPGQRIVNTINAAPCLAFGSCGNQPCFTPQDVTATYAPNTWTISWASVPGASSFTVEYRLSSNPNWTTAPNVTGNSFNFGGLDPGVTAHARVRSNCTNFGTTNYSQPVSFTGVNFCSLPGFLGASNITTTSALISWSSAAATNIIEYKAASSGTWISLGALSGSSTTLSGLSPYTLYDWRVKPVCDASPFPGYTASQFTTAAPPCNAPANLATYNSTLQWGAVSGAVSYTVQYKPASASTWTTVTGVATNSYTIGSYTGGTLYDWQVKTVCGGNESGYTAAQFTTPGQCATLSNLTSTDITGTSATVNWTINGSLSGIQTIHLEYKPASSSTWIVDNVGRNSTTTYGISGLTQGTLYDWRVRPICGNTVFEQVPGLYTSAQFTTLVTCATPTNLSADNSGCCGDVYFYWGAVSGAQSYTLEFKRTNNSNWSVIDNIIGNGIDMNLAGGAYNWRVKANCTGGSSAYADGANVFVLFNPRCCDPELRTTATEATKNKENSQLQPALRVSPQPANGQLSVYFNALADGKLMLSLTDQFGRPVIQQNKLVAAGANQLRLDVSKLTAGIYIIKANCGTQAETIKVIVQH